MDSLSFQLRSPNDGSEIVAFPISVRALGTSGFYRAISSELSIALVVIGFRTKGCIFSQALSIFTLLVSALRRELAHGMMGDQSLQSHMTHTVMSCLLGIGARSG